MKKNKLEGIIENLWHKSKQHYQAVLSVDSNRLVGFYACTELAEQLEHEHKLVTQENIKL